MFCVVFFIIIQASSDLKIHVWDCSTGVKFCEYPITEIGNFVKFCPDSLMFASTDTNLTLWQPPAIQ